MRVRSYTSAPDTARAAARCIGRWLQDAVDARDRFTLALSGGRTPWLMLRELSRMTLPWDRCHLFQVDERVAPRGDQSRNLTHIESNLLRTVPIRPSTVYPMPVERHDLQSAANRYAAALASICGTPPVLDLVVLGLGADGHTASLVPGDPALDAASSCVAVTQAYRGARRMTLTFPALNRARRRLWLVTGEEKAEMLHRLLDGDPSIPAGRVARHGATVFADAAALAKHDLEKSDE